MFSKESKNRGRSNSVDTATTATASITDSQSDKHHATTPHYNLTVLFQDISNKIEKLNNNNIDTFVQQYLGEPTQNKRKTKYNNLIKKIQTTINDSYFHTITSSEKLARDAYLIKSIGFRNFVGNCMGESTHNGWAGKNRQDHGKSFMNSSAYISYRTQKEDFFIMKGLRNGENSTNVKSVWNFENQEDEASTSFRYFFDKSIYETEVNLTTKLGKKKKFGIISLLDEFVKYVNLKRDIEVEFKRVTDIIFKEEQVDLKTINDKTFKLLLCFSWNRIYPNEIAGEAIFTEGGGGYPSTESTQLTIHKSKSQFTRIIMYMFSIMSFIYFTFVLFESYRLLNSSIQRIQDARATYLEMYPGQVESEEDASFTRHIYAFLKIMYEIGAGTIITTLNRITPEVIDNVKLVLTTTATTAGQQHYDNCADSWFGCVNNFLTGQAQARFFSDSSNKQQELMDIAYIQQKYKAKSLITSLRYDFTSGSYNFVTALHGLTFATVLSLHLLFPEYYKKEIVFASAATLGSSYTINPLYGLYGLGGHLTILFYPSMINKIEDETFPNDEIYKRIEREEGRLGQANADNISQVRQKNQAIMNVLIEDAYNADYEDYDEDDNSQGTFGGRKKRTIKRKFRKMRTMKKNKNKKTKRRFVK